MRPGYVLQPHSPLKKLAAAVLMIMTYLRGDDGDGVAGGGGVRWDQIKIVAQWVEISKNADSNIGIIGDETLGCRLNGFLGLS